jgi:hypothetical protein
LLLQNCDAHRDMEPVDPVFAYLGAGMFALASHPRVRPT